MARSAPAQTPAPDPVLSLAERAALETITRAERVYVDVDGTRCLADDGSLVAVQREQRADGSLGPMMLAFLKRTSDGRETGTRVELAPIQAASDAFAARGLALLRPFNG